MMNVHDAVRENKRKSVFIIGIFFLFFLFLGFLSGVVFSLYATGEFFNLYSMIYSIGLAFIIALVYIMIFMSQGDKMILKATGATEASRKDYPYLYHTTEALSLAAGMRVTPKCYVIDDPALNAYATGFKPENSYVVVTTGLLKKLDRQEIEGVLAHEISHIKNQDIKVMLLAAGLVGATVLLADLLFRMFLFSPNRGGGNNSNGKAMIFVLGIWIFLVVLSPIIANMIKLAISRRREYLADANGALLTRYPEGLASALEKIKGDPSPLDDKANKATAHLFISNPFKAKNSSTMKNLFSTHPPIDDRIARLRGQKK